LNQPTIGLRRKLRLAALITAAAVTLSVVSVVPIVPPIATQGTGAVAVAEASARLSAMKAENADDSAIFAALGLRRFVGTSAMSAVAYDQQWPGVDRTRTDTWVEVTRPEIYFAPGSAPGYTRSYWYAVSQYRWKINDDDVGHQTKLFSYDVGGRDGFGIRVNEALIPATWATPQIVPMR
jgi:hypothetical protein